MFKIIILSFLLTVSTAHEINESYVEFRFYSQENPLTYIPLIRGQLSDVPFDGSKQTIFIFHSYLSDADFSWVIDMKDAYLQKDDYNVINVNWCKVAFDIYSSSVYHAKDVGRFTGDLIMELHNIFGLQFSDVHLVGHSLGAHIAGFTGKYINNTTTLSLKRITGLDPAGPEFCDEEDSERLCDTDALFVDIIHTDTYKLGCANHLGHATFYPNGETLLQPGCLTKRKRDLEDTASTVACSHNRAYKLFIESILSNGFIAYECSGYIPFLWGNCYSNNIAIMGQNIDLKTRGKYYLNTYAFPPYAQY